MSDPNLNTPAPRAAKPGRGFRIALGLSLALNLLVLGTAAGLALKGPPGRVGPPSVREISAPYVLSFDRTAKREMRRQMKAQLPGRSEMIAQNKADYAAFISLVRAVNFDEAAVQAVLVRQHARAAQMQQLGRDLAIKRLAGMSLDARRAYADRVEHWLERREKRRLKAMH